MDIVIDTSALMAVIINEPERGDIIELTNGNTLIGPGSIPWEIGNAYDAYFLDCAMAFSSPLLTLDKKLQKAAQSLKLKILEVQK